MFLGVIALVGCNAVNPAFDESLAQGSGTDAKPTTTDTPVTTTEGPVTTSVGMTSGMTATGGGSNSGNRPETDTQLDTLGEDTDVEDTGRIECTHEPDPRIYSRCDSPSCTEVGGGCVGAESPGPVIYGQEACLAECESDCDCRHSLDGDFSAVCEPGLGCVIECTDDSGCPGEMLCHEGAQICLWDQLYGPCDESCVGECYSILEGTYEFCSHIDCDAGPGASDDLCPAAPAGATAVPSCAVEDPDAAFGCALRCTFNAQCPGEMVCAQGFCFHAT